LSFINCSENCIYQENGKCSLDHVNPQLCSSKQDCGFFLERKKKREKPSGIIVDNNNTLK